ncbi:MAG: hypothetical protein K9H49_11850 [Bacteroidales bacterium]|nr:hypothetical protein [Bacteroidales bacterium]MCF8391042.1 hypothetical protein [Bacteroidales bacterium]
METTDKEIIISIIENAFAENPRLKTMAKKNREKASIRGMTKYAYKLVKKFDGVYLSKDKTTVLFYYRKSQYRMTFMDYIRYSWMYVTCLKYSQFIPTMKRESKIVSLRPDIPDYIYVWILASVPNNKSLNGLADIRDHLFGMSKELGLPIIIETVVEKVIRLYKYVGFEIYHEWYDKDADLNVRFLKKGDIGEYTKK